MDTGCGLHSEEFDALKIMEQIKELTKKITDTFCNAELTDLLNDSFMQKHTEYDNVAQFAEAGGFDFSSKESVDAYLRMNLKNSRRHTLRSKTGMICLSALWRNTLLKLRLRMKRKINLNLSKFYRESVCYNTIS